MWEESICRQMLLENIIVKTNLLGEVDVTDAGPAAASILRAALSELRHL